jgi:hypothetical protein
MLNTVLKQAHKTHDETTCRVTAHLSRRGMKTGLINGLSGISFTATGATADIHQNYLVGVRFGR